MSTTKKRNTITRRSRKEHMTHGTDGVAMMFGLPGYSVNMLELDEEGSIMLIFRKPGNTPLCSILPANGEASEIMPCPPKAIALLEKMQAFYYQNEE